jgi:hypothetical protein
MRLIASLFALLLLLPLVTAEVVQIHASKSHQSSITSAPLVEWFHGPDDDEIVEELEEMDLAGKINLVHWRTGAGLEGGGWPGDEANTRVISYGIENGTGIAINGVYIDSRNPLAAIDNATWSQQKIEMGIGIEIRGDFSPESIVISSDFSSDYNLSSHTQLHVFMLESNARDNHGRTVHNLLRDWAPNSEFSGDIGVKNNWSIELTSEHLEGAGIDLEDTAFTDRYEIMVVMTGGIDGDENTTILSFTRTSLPTHWQSEPITSLLAPVIISSVIITGIVFVILSEREREKGLPTLEGRWAVKGERVEYTLTAGNVDVEIGDVKFTGGWKSSGKIKENKLVANSTVNGMLKVHGSGEFNLHLPISTEYLGEWMLDLRLPDPAPMD